MDGRKVVEEAGGRGEEVGGKVQEARGGKKGFESPDLGMSRVGGSRVAFLDLVVAGPDATAAGF